MAFGRSSQVGPACCADQTNDGSGHCCALAGTSAWGDAGHCCSGTAQSGRCVAGCSGCTGGADCKSGVCAFFSCQPGTGDSGCQ